MSDIILSQYCKPYQVFKSVRTVYQCSVLTFLTRILVFFLKLSGSLGQAITSVAIFQQTSEVYIDIDESLKRRYSFYLPKLQKKTSSSSKIYLLCYHKEIHFYWMSLSSWLSLALWLAATLRRSFCEDFRFMSHKIRLLVEKILIFLKETILLFQSTEKQ